MKKTLLFLAALMLILTIQAQQQFTNFGSKNTITSIAEKGSQVWIGTSSGLYVRSKSTGVIILNYTMDNGLPSNYVNDVYIDPFDNVWVATTKGLAKFDGSSWVVYNQDSGLPHDNVREITRDYNNIWVSSGIYGRNLCKLENNNTWTNYGVSDGVPGTLLCLVTSSDGKIWMGTWGDGAYNFDPNTEVFTQHLGFGASEVVNDIIKDANDNLWFGTNEGIYKYDGSILTPYIVGICNELTIDIAGHIWVAKSYGVTDFDPGSEMVTEYYESASGLCQFGAQAIKSDSDGNIWIGTQWGLNRYKVEDFLWSTFIVSNSVSNNTINDIKVAQSGDIWVGTDYGLSRLSGDIWTNWFSEDGLSNDLARCISIDPNGDLWIGGASGLFFFDVGANSFISYLAGVHDFANVYDVYPNADGTIWIASSNGLTYYDGTDWTHYTTTEGIVDDFCIALTKDAVGNLWIATNNGLSMWDGNSFTNYTTADGLPDYRLKSVFIDNNGIVWASTHFGIGKFDGTTWTTITTSDGLPNNAVSELAQSPDGKFWMATYAGGIIKYDGINFGVYTSEDGVASDMVYDVAIASGGVKWFGTNAGLVKAECENPIPAFTSDVTCLPDATIFTDTSLQVDPTSIYEWDINNDGSVEYTTANPSHTFITEGTYSVKIIITNDECSSEIIQDVTVYDVPSVTLNPSGNVNICSGSSTNIQIQDGAGYSFEWSTGATEDFVSISEVGTYTVTITNGTCTYEPSPVIVNIMEPIEPKICMVSVDLDTDKNLIVWEKPVSDSIDYYYIYKEIATNNYQIIGSMNYDEISEFVDYNSVPDVHADRYKISIVDMCGNESELSPYHQTMNLSQAQGAQYNEIVLIWNKYEDESGDFIPSTYNVYRGFDETSLYMDGFTTGSLETYNYNALSVVNNEKFIVLIDMPTCTPTIGGAKASGGPYYQSSSNIEDEGIIATGIKPTLSEQLEIFPNPMNDFTLIKSDMNIEQIKIFNIMGELIRNISDINTNEYKLLRGDIAKGTYIIEINNSVHQKLIIE